MTSRTPGQVDKAELRSKYTFGQNGGRGRGKVPLVETVMRGNKRQGGAFRPMPLPNRNP